MIPIRYQIGDTELYCIRTDRFKTEKLMLRYLLPLDAEKQQMNLLLTEVLKMGTQRYPSKRALNQRMDDLYSTDVVPFRRRMGDMYRFGFCADFLGARFVGGGNGLLPDALELMSEMWKNPLTENGLLRERVLAREKEALCDAIRSEKTSPSFYAKEKCKNLLCKGEPWSLSHLGTEADVAIVTPENLTAYHQSILQNEKPVFWYMGAMEPAAVAELIAKHLPNSVGTVRPYQTIVSKGEGEAVLATEDLDVNQGKLCIGFRSDIAVGHPLDPALVLLNEIYGGSPSSKLFVNVREKRSLCYHCSSGLDAYKGVLFARSGMHPENRAVTEEAMQAELAAIAAGNVTENELNVAKRGMDFQYRRVNDQPGALIDYYDRLLVRGVSYTPERRRAALNAVTVDQVVEAASHLRHGATFFVNGTAEGEEDDE